MTMKLPNIEENSNNVFSQFGEDGILNTILSRMRDCGISLNSWCVEFGAWDGIHHSNSFNLISSFSWKAVLIEGDNKRFMELQKNVSAYDVITKNIFVATKGINSLDEILKQTIIPNDFDLLCIDIDGNDYNIWESLEGYKPKIVIIEYNPSIPLGVNFIQSDNPAINQGSSITSFIDLAEELGYELASITLTNVIFIRNEIMDELNYDLHTLYIPEWLLFENASVIFSGYDGTIHLSNSHKMYWHDLEISDSQIQLIPQFLRKFPGNYTIIERFLFRLWRFSRKPKLITRFFSRFYLGN